MKMLFLGKLFAGELLVIILAGALFGWLIKLLLRSKSLPAITSLILGGIGGPLGGIGGLKLWIYIWELGLSDVDRIALYCGKTPSSGMIILFSIMGFLFSIFLLVGLASIIAKQNNQEKSETK